MLGAILFYMDYTPLFKKRSILYIKNASERSFFYFLLRYFAHEYTIVPQVHVLNLIELQPTCKKYIHNNQVLRILGQKSIDFVLYDKQELTAVLCLEVNGGYHNSEKQKKRDEKKISLLQSAGIQVVSFDAKERYGEEDRDVIIKALLQTSKTSVQEK